MRAIMTKICKYYLGIDLGGTFIKGGIVDGEGKILLRDKVPTESEKGSDGVVSNIVSLCRSLMEKLDISVSDLVGVGMGIPGTVDSKRGEVVYANNLGWQNFVITDKISEALGLPVKIANDASVAVLGESRFGCGKGYRHVVMITLGTGVGGGLLLNGNLFEGNHSAGGELGHMVIVKDGEPCTCGRRGCIEAYASVTALIRDTKRAMEKNPESKLWEIGSLDAVTGKTAFDYLEKDQTAKAVVDRYLEMVGVSIVNMANLIRPEIIILGGGICAEGERLLRPLREMLAREIHGGDTGPAVKIVTAELGNDAGLLGAAALLM